MKCKGIIAPNKGEIVLTEVDIVPPGPDEVQVRMCCTMLSPGTERAHILALPNSNQTFPYVPGYCCAGYVEQTGGQVQGFAPGDRVACFAEGVGHREAGNVAVHRVVHIPDSMSYEYAAFNGLAQTALQGVRKCRIELGESVLVLGLGIVGQLALQFARTAGAIPTIGVDRNEKRLQIARECGADFVFGNVDRSVRSCVEEVLGYRGADVVLDSTGAPAALVDACKAAANYGRLCIVGCPRGTVDFDFYTDIQLKTLTVIGAHAVFSVPRDHSSRGLWTYADDIACFCALVLRGDVRLEPLISERISWQDAEKAYKALLSWSDESLAVMIHWPEYQ